MRNSNNEAENINSQIGGRSCRQNEYIGDGRYLEIYKAVKRKAGRIPRRFCADAETDKDNKLKMCESIKEGK